MCCDASFITSNTDWMNEVGTDLWSRSLFVLWRLRIVMDSGVYILGANGERRARHKPDTKDSIYDGVTRLTL